MPLRRLHAISARPKGLEIMQISPIEGLRTAKIGLIEQGQG